MPDYCCTPKLHTKKYIFYVHMCVWVCVCAPRLLRSSWRSEEALDCVQLELQMARSHHVDAGNSPRSLARPVGSLLTAELSLQPQLWDFYLPGTTAHSWRLQGFCRLTALFSCYICPDLSLNNSLILLHRLEWYHKALGEPDSSMWGSWGCTLWLPGNLLLHWKARAVL